MPHLSSIKFQKFDNFNNFVCIASEKIDKVNYEILKDYAHKLEKMNYGTFIPIFHNDQHSYTNIRFFKSNKFKMVEDNKYDIEFDIKIKEKNNKKYVNCHIKTLKFVSKPMYDEGEVLVL